MPIGGRAVSFNCGRLSRSLSLSFDGLSCGVAASAAETTNEANPAPKRCRWMFMAAAIVRPNLSVACGSSDNNRMSQAVKIAQIACTAGPLSRVESDVLIVPWFEGEAAGAVPGIDEAIGGELQRALAGREFEGRPYELLLTVVADRSWTPRRVALVGAGKPADFSSELARRVAAMIGLTVKQRRITRAA